MDNKGKRRTNVQGPWRRVRVLDVLGHRKLDPGAQKDDGAVFGAGGKDTASIWANSEYITGSDEERWNAWDTATSNITRHSIIERDSWRWIPAKLIHEPSDRRACHYPRILVCRRPDIRLQSLEYDVPHIITALLSLSILRDDFSKLDRSGIVQFLKTLCQPPDESFSTIPNGNETNLRTLYCAFAISRMLSDWLASMSTMLSHLPHCTYEGGYGPSLFCEAHGGITYVAIASLYLAPTSESRLSTAERQKTIRWPVQRQDNDGGFHGRTNKESDACYCFWSGAALQASKPFFILGAQDLFDANGICRFIAECQFKYGGIAKAPRDHPGMYNFRSKGSMLKKA
ncbi:terpenoid cyclases/protein prenyltransferase alpha-alpha toroid [Mycena floridula]|nr:terpenoid cyclases/protein prenyltransferase alpha-alpha toroid [Mycena floridula]